MIAFIKGTVESIEEDALVIEAGGIGYRVFMPLAALTKIQRTGAEVKVHTYMNVKEDAMQLYGFLTADDLQVFKMIIAVSGIGPKGGLSILSTLSANDLRFAVVSGDAKAISASPGIGKKTAEKLILELKDKLKIEDALERIADEDSYAPSAGVMVSDIGQDTIAALISLGYGSTEALKAVRQVTITDGMQVEDVLKQALKNLMF